MLTVFLYQTSYVILGHIPLSLMRFVWVVVHRWMISVGCLHYDFDIRCYTGAYSTLLDEICLSGDAYMGD